MNLSSPSFEAGQTIPKRHTGDGEDVSPPLEWNEVPEATREFALTCTDPDAPGEKPFTHWVVAGISSIRRSLTVATAGGGFEGVNDFGCGGYRGPMPPNGDGPHRYCFTLYALDDTLGLGAGVTIDELKQEMSGHVLETAELQGVYERL